MKFKELRLLKIINNTEYTILNFEMTHSNFSLLSKGFTKQGNKGEVKFVPKNRKQSEKLT
jgi:hypothetical protein